METLQRLRDRVQALTERTQNAISWAAGVVFLVACLVAEQYTHGTAQQYVSGAIGGLVGAWLVLWWQQRNSRR